MNRKTLNNAINEFLNKIKQWELNNHQKELLELSMQGNCGAFCELIASSFINGDPCFDEFYNELNSDGADYD